MNKLEMLACLSKFEVINEEIKQTGKNVYMSINFTRTTFSDEIQYTVCAIDEDKTYVRLQFEHFPDTQFKTSKVVNWLDEVLEALEGNKKNGN